MTDPVMAVYVTAPNRDVASDLAKTVVSERLAACANISNEILSIYHWDGEIMEDAEISILFKTVESRQQELTDRLIRLHPYECPCITVWPVQEGNPAYLQWVRNETKA